MSGNEERAEQPPAIPLPELPGKLRLFLDGVLVLSVQLANQKWGALVPRWIVVLGFALGCVPLGYDVIRLDRFIKAKGKISEAFKDHKFSFVFVALLVLVLCLGGFGSRTTGVQLASVPINTPPPLGPSSAPNTPLVPPVVVAPATTVKPVGPKVPVPPTVKLTRPKEPKPDPQSAPPAGSASAQPPPPPQAAPFPFPNMVCTGGSACVGQNNGTVIGTQNNFGPPPPQIIGPSLHALNPVPAFQPIPNDPNRMARVSEYNNSLGFERANKQYTVNPGLALTFKVSPAFTDPDFKVGCDHPCQITSISTFEGDGRGNYSFTGGLPSVLGKNQSVTITVRSLDAANPVTNAGVEPNLQ
jgi:hypothetical protein